MITLRQITCEMSYIIGSQLQLDRNGDGQLTATQTHVDFPLTNEELSQTMDDLSEKMLVPAAHGLLDRMKRGNARYSYDLAAPSSEKGVDWCKHRFEGIHIRGIINRNYKLVDSADVEVIINMLRFDMLWSQ